MNTAHDGVTESSGRHSGWDETASYQANRATTERRVISLSPLWLRRVREEHESVKRQYNLLNVRAPRAPVVVKEMTQFLPHAEWLKSFCFQQRTPPPSPVRSTEHPPRLSHNAARVCKLSLPDWLRRPESPDGSDQSLNTSDDWKSLIQPQQMRPRLVCLRWLLCALDQFGNVLNT